jgi:hypothetical protein
VISSQPLGFPAMANRINENYSLASSYSGSRRAHRARPIAMPSGSFPDNDDYCISAYSGMTYPSMGASDAPYALPVMSNLSNFDDVDLAAEYLTEDAFANTMIDDMTFVPNGFPAHGYSQDMSAGNLPMEQPVYMPVATSYNASDFSQRLTPPPEEYVSSYLSSQASQEQDCLMDDDYINRQSPPDRSELALSSSLFSILIWCDDAAQAKGH